MLESIRKVFSEKSEKDTDKKDKSRRDFMKTVAAGTVATGVYATIPNASAFSISSEDPIQFFNSSSSDPNLEIKESGETDLQNNDIVNADRVEASEVNLSDSGNNGKTLTYDEELDTLVVVDE